jgi:ATP-dependent RNA helicase HelY
VLAHLGYLEHQDAGLAVTPTGQILGRLYSERDLLAAECLARGIWVDLEPDELAAAASTLVFESRREEAEPAPIPDGRLGAVLTEMDTIWGELKDIESQYRTDYLPDIDPGFVWPALRWARGQNLPKSLRDTDLQPGDFVRWTKQVIDILGQIAIADVAISRTARQAVDAINRGIVAW